jgi:AcrR family transcriptional regulator
VNLRSVSELTVERGLVNAHLTSASKPSVRSAPTKKGQLTRARILDAGRAVLADRGYFGATVGEIAERSGLALGSTYRYFDNKDELFLELLEELVETLYTSVTGSWIKDNELESLRESSRRYLETYRANRHLIAGLLEMSAAVPECADLWWNLREKTFGRKSLYLQRVDSDSSLNPEYAAAALGTMVEQLAYHWYIESEKRGATVPSVDEAAQTVSLIWYRAIYAYRVDR